MKPFSEASERNKEPILSLLRKYFAKSRLVLEIGSGTGQHAAYFAAKLPHLIWQPCDVEEHLAGIRLWTDEIKNINKPAALDVDGEWPLLHPDAAFTANTCHIMSWPQVERMFAGLGRMDSLDTLCIYGPFNYGGRHTAESNARFDAMLRERDPQSGLREIEDMLRLGKEHGFHLDEDNAMPANNRLLAFRKDAHA